MAKRKPPDKGDAPESPPRSGRNSPVRVAGETGRLARAMAGRAGFATLSVATRWREIAGEGLAAHTVPLSVTRNQSGGTLLIRADGGAALLVQHQSRELIARVNAVLGEGAVTQIKVSQGVIEPIPKQRPAPKPTTPRLSSAEEEAIRQSVAGVEDEALRDRLASLMRRVVGTPQRR